MIHRTALAFCSLLLAVAGVQAQASAAAAPVSSAPAAPEQRAGTIKSVRGDVRLQSRDATDAHAASAGEAVQPIDRILTGADSGASLVMRDGTAIVVGPSSRLDVKDFRFDSTTEDGGLVVALLRGSLRMATGLIGKTHPEAVHVETPTAVIGIRGTDFIVETDSQQ